jgi:hypothetical protein
LRQTSIRAKQKWDLLDALLPRSVAKRSLHGICRQKEDDLNQNDCQYICVYDIFTEYVVCLVSV